MSEKNPAEYRAVIGLYEDGRIDRAERDRLLAALGFDPSVANVPDPVDDTEATDTQSAHYELKESDNGAAKPQEKADGDGSTDVGAESGQPRKLTEVLNSIGSKINKAFSKAGKKIADAANSISRSLGGSDAKEKFERKKFDEPFEDLRVSVDYTKGESKSSVSDSAKHYERVLDRCEEFMSDGAFDALEARLNEKFTGRYEYENGDEIFTLCVLPD